MPLSKFHKDQSRRRILDAAGALFRRHGFDGVGIDAIMAEADLTRGAFYAHFGSKAELFAEVLAQQPGLIRRLETPAGASRREAHAAALDALAWYLNPEAVPHVAATCPMVSLSRDVDKGGPKARAAMGKIVDQLSGLLKNGMTARTDARRADARALATLALCVGGVTIARTAPTQRLAKAVVDACRIEAERLLGVPSRKSARRRAKE
jgi:AcrR family transcriptional regulator